LESEIKCFTFKSCDCSRLIVIIRISGGSGVYILGAWGGHCSWGHGPIATVNHP